MLGLGIECVVRPGAVLTRQHTHDRLHAWLGQRCRQTRRSLTEYMASTGLADVQISVSQAREAQYGYIPVPGSKGGQVSTCTPTSRPDPASSRRGAGTPAGHPGGGARMGGARTAACTEDARSPGSEGR